ncbi:FadD7 family fatty acid--CoA ligase [Mycobacterium sp. DL99]|uniref:FadD7 family fatty acid--CoA ligase n=1 Tax=Mycobacterium sp. DL99 TaxID=2528957 RepID=UPI00256FBE0D|nr:FadD7 family fatty acid--CoA ligase [Mycobacterium sp. DL99]
MADHDASSWHLGHIIDEPTEIAPTAGALVVGAERNRITYGDLAELVVAHCIDLLHGGLEPGDVIALQSTNSIEFVVALIGAVRAGLVVAPLDPALPWNETQARADRIGARAILTDKQRPVDGATGGCPQWLVQIGAGGAVDEKPEMRLVTTDSARMVAASAPGLTDRDALIMFTSGTTGTPKLVPWTHANLAASVAGIVTAYQLGRTDATVAVMPLFHGHGLVATLLATLASGGAVALPARGRFSAGTFADDAAAVGATWYTAVPTIHQILLERASAEPRGGDRGRWRFLRSCSAPLAAATVRRMEAMFNAPVLMAYGMTETTHQASSVLPSAGESARLYTVGTPTSSSVRIADGFGAPCPPGATGEIWVRGPAVVRGYLGNAEATAETFVDGWVRSGDLGTVDGHGNLAIQGRIKELINRGGEKISPEHVEEVLMSYPGVAQAAVIGIADPLYGERVGAIIVRHKGSELDMADLNSFCRDRLAPFEMPERITFADRIPLTAKGSVDRTNLRAYLPTGAK